MKQGLLIWNILLTLLTGYLLITHFSTKNVTTKNKEKTNTDSVGINSNFRMAYFEMDSVEANFNMVKDIKAELGKREDAISIEMDGLSKKFQQKYKFFQDKAQAGTLTPAESEAASQELKNMDDQIKSRKQVLDEEYNNFAMRRMKDIKSRIEQFVKV